MRGQRGLVNRQHCQQLDALQIAAKARFAAITTAISPPCAPNSAAANTQHGLREVRSLGKLSVSHLCAMHSRRHSCTAHAVTRCPGALLASLVRCLSLFTIPTHETSQQSAVLHVQAASPNRNGLRHRRMWRRTQSYGRHCVSCWYRIAVGAMPTRPSALPHTHPAAGATPRRCSSAPADAW